MLNLPSLTPSAHPSTASRTVLHLLPARKGQALRTALQQAMATADLGWQVTLAVPPGCRGVECERSHLPQLLWPASWWQQLRELDILMAAHPFAVLHSHDACSGWLALRSARRTGAHLISSLHEPIPMSPALARFFYSGAVRGEQVLVSAAFLAEAALATGATPQTLRLIPPSVDLRRFNPDHVSIERMAALAQSWRLPDTLKRILCPARLAPEKGQLQLLAACARLERRDFVLLLAGNEQYDPSYTKLLEQQVQTLGLVGHVMMVGHTADLPAAYMQADVIAIPTPQPRGQIDVALEAQALGRPVIASAVGAAPELIAAGITGWLCPPNDTAAWTQALDNALSLDASTRQQVAQQAITLVHTHFHPQQQLTALAEIYQ